MVTLKDIQIECEKDSEGWFPNVNGTLGYRTLGLVGETGEFADIVKKLARGSLNYDDKEVRYDMAMELADILIYLCLVANLCDVDLTRVYEIKREMNVERFGSGTS